MSQTAFSEIWRQTRKPQAPSWPTTPRKFKVKAATVSLGAPLIPWDSRASAQRVVLRIVCVTVLINRGANSACLQRCCFIRCAARMKLTPGTRECQNPALHVAGLSPRYPLSYWKRSARTDLNLLLSCDKRHRNDQRNIKQVLTKMPAASDLHFAHLLQTWFMEKLKL